MINETGFFTAFMQLMQQTDTFKQPISNDAGQNAVVCDFVQAFADDMEYDLDTASQLA